MEISKLFYILLALTMKIIVFAQTIEFPKLPDSTKILFIGEAHRIFENHIIQFDLINHYTNHESFNGIILEQSSIFQPIVDNLIKYQDTTALNYLSPIIVCQKENCNHDFKPVKDFLIKVTDFARKKNIPIFCLDTEEDFIKTKEVFLSIIDSTYRTKLTKRDPFLKLRESKTHTEIKEEFLNLNDTKQKLKNKLPESTYVYISRILMNIYLQKDENRYLKLREKYLFNQINSLFKTNQDFKPIAIYGLAHVHKHCDPNENGFSRPMHVSLASMLNNDTESFCKNRVVSIATTYFFNSDSDSIYTSMGYFEEKDLTSLKNIAKTNKFSISKSSNLPLSSYLQKAFDYVITIQDCHKIYDHTEFYYKK